MRKNNDRKQQNFDRLLRQFRRRVQRSVILEEVRKRQHYIKPSEKRKNALNAAKRREKRNLASNSLPPRKPHSRY